MKTPIELKFKTERESPLKQKEEAKEFLGILYYPFSFTVLMFLFCSFVFLNLLFIYLVLFTYNGISSEIRKSLHSEVSTETSHVFSVPSNSKNTNPLIIPFGESSGFNGSTGKLNISGASCSHKYDSTSSVENRFNCRTSPSFVSPTFGSKIKDRFPLNRIFPNVIGSFDKFLNVISSHSQLSLTNTLLTSPLNMNMDFNFETLKSKIFPANFGTSISNITITQFN